MVGKYLEYEGLGHLFVSVFLYYFASFMVIPVITDVTMAAVCPGRDECSAVIYLTGLQQVMTGMGTLVVTPVVGKLSDEMGRKALLTFPMTIAVLPLAVLAYGRSKPFVYCYFVLKTLTAMACDGSIQCLSTTYLADCVPVGVRTSAFGLLSGTSLCAFVFGTLTAKLLSVPAAFMAASTIAGLAVAYMVVFLPERERGEFYGKVEGVSRRERGGQVSVWRSLPSVSDFTCLLSSSSTFSNASVVTFFSTLGETGLQASLLYYLKARFHFDKNQFADILLICGIAGATSQMLFMPILATAVGEEKLLRVGLFACCAHTFLYCIAWSSAVPYIASMFAFFTVFTTPCIGSIVSKQVGADEQLCFYRREHHFLSQVSASCVLVLPL
ncbi:tetracycline resistance protein, class A isoform X2 [Amborella trichopoda]|uniref:tetracycline resistance protein, class A isoform X2 n=1 Tax=Amborella trichopoda TaxID=13333 RepID=UPI0005D339B2|nr:tetracycline resistance protein, class A isoform X2 [Amborella trichopoda]|eukprot:XP_011628920.1 tetracycline resistance protein, class A isoform X2 [Amborella trichopoda]